MVTPKSELAQTAQTIPAEMIKEAVAKGADLDKLEKLLELQERWERNEARKSYHEAMSAFKGDPPKIDKDRKVAYSTSKGPVSYKHATLANVTEKINLALSKFGLSASWSTDQQNGHITVTCKITHAQGHSEQTSLWADADMSGSKNPIQAVGSTISYLERYTLLALTGLATYDQDDDGLSAAPQEEKISDKQLHTLRDQLVELNIKEEKLTKFLGVEKLEDLPISQFQKASHALETKRKAKNT